MDAETLARATEPFFTTKGTGKGTGLGLSMVHGMVEQLGGQLILHSKPGEGTTAELWLPAAEQPAATVGRRRRLRRSSGRRPLTVLAVDDDALVLANTRAMLEDLGHTVIVAYSGEQALEQLERTSAVDLVITDHAMPKMTGSDLAKKISARRPGMPIILATGYAELPTGADAGLPRLSKPYRQDALADAVASAVRTRRGSLAVAERSRRESTLLKDRRDAIVDGMIPVVSSSPSCLACFGPGHCPAGQHPAGDDKRHLPARLHHVDACRPVGPGRPQRLLRAGQGGADSHGVGHARRHRRQLPGLQGRCEPGQGRRRPAVVTAARCRTPGRPTTRPRGSAPSLATATT